MANKTTILTKLLNTDELNQLKQLLLNQKKERQAILLETLAAITDYKLEKEQIFYTVYDNKYSTDKDYLLRNDLRKLSQSIIHFIKNDVAEDKKEVSFFKVLLNRKAKQLFDKEIGKAIAKAKKAKRNELYELQKIHFTYIIRNSARKLEPLKLVHSNLLKCIAQTPTEKANFKTYFILLLSIVERIMWQHFNLEFSDLSILIDKKTLKKDKDANYQYEKALSFQLFGKKRISQLEKCNSILKHTTKNTNSQIESSYLQSQLGLEYFLIPDFIKSEFHFKHAYNKIDLLDESQKLQLIYNYASMLCATEKFIEVDKMLNKYASLFKATPFEHNVSLFALMAKINSNQLNDLRSLLPLPNDAIAKDAQVYIRILECIILYYESEFELCLSYLKNIYNTSRYNQFLDKAFLEFAKLFSNYISALLILDRKEKKDKLQSCLKASNEFIDAYQLGFGSNMLCSVWLNKTIKANS